MKSNKKINAKKIKYNTSALERDYKRYLKAMNNDILESIKYWLLPMFDRDIMQDSPQKPQNQKKPAFKDLDLDTFQVGDIVKHKLNPALSNMQVESINKNIVMVNYNNQTFQFKKTELEKQLIKIPYSKNDTLADRLAKIKINTQAISEEYANLLAKKVLRNSLKDIDKRFKSGFGIDFNSIPFSQEIKDKIQIIYNNNASLIKTIPQNIIKSLDSILQNASLGGNRESITKALNQLKGTTEKQITRIARDQTAKALNGVSMLRAKEAGFEYYEWVTAGDERVSTGVGGHKQLNGKIFRYDKPEAIIDKKGTKGHPAQRVNCRCTCAPIYLEANQKIVKDTIGYKIVEI